MALASMPLLVEQACRYRVVTPEEMGRYRVTWSKIVGLISVDPEVVRQRSDLEMLRRALPEISKVQPRGLYREVIVTASCYEPRFARDVGGLVAAPAEQGLRKDAFRRVLCVPPPAYVEDSEVGPGLCCACGKGGSFGPLYSLWASHALLLRRPYPSGPTTAVPEMQAGIR